MFVSNRMTANPITIDADATIVEAAELMKTHKFRRLPIMEKGKLVGIVTDRDLREVAPSSATTLSVYELNYLLAKMKVRDIMKKNVITVLPTATIEQAALILYKEKIGGLVVVDTAGEVVGLITETDIFKTFVDAMGITCGRTTRITIDINDQVGVLSEVTAVFKDLNTNITSLVLYPMDRSRYEMVIRCDTADPEGLRRRLEESGYSVVHMGQIC